MKINVLSYQWSGSSDNTLMFWDIECQIFVPTCKQIVFDELFNEILTI